MPVELLLLLLLPWCVVAALQLGVHSEPLATPAAKSLATRANKTLATTATETLATCAKTLATTAAKTLAIDAVTLPAPTATRALQVAAHALALPPLHVIRPAALLPPRGAQQRPRVILYRLYFRLQAVAYRRHAPPRNGVWVILCSDAQP